MNGVTSNGSLSRADRIGTGLALTSEISLRPGVQVHARPKRQGRQSAPVSPLPWPPAPASGPHALPLCLRWPVGCPGWRESGWAVAPTAPEQRVEKQPGVRQAPLGRASAPAVPARLGPPPPPLRRRGAPVAAPEQFPIAQHGLVGKWSASSVRWPSAMCASSVLKHHGQTRLVRQHVHHTHG